jgi:glutamine cyclotransferase
MDRSNRIRILWFFFIFGLTAAFTARCAPKEKPVPHKAPLSLKPSIVRTLDHDPGAFTQGLAFSDGLLYETTGLVGRSSLRRINPLDGSVMKKNDIPGVFAEGMTVCGRMFVVLTWREETAIHFTYPDMKQAGHWKYTGEGWGLTHDGSQFIMSDGSDTLFLRDTATFEVRGKIGVTLDGKPLGRLNELEYAEGKLYANVWYCDSLFEIDLSSGKVTGVFDCTELADIAAVRRSQDVLNGIAYNPGAKTFFVTGKNWRYVFEVRMQ